MLPGYLLALGLGCKDDGIGGDCPIGSGIEGKGGGQGGVKEEEDDKEYYNGGKIYYLKVESISTNIWRRRQDPYGDRD